MAYKLRTILCVIAALCVVSSGVRAQENIQGSHAVDADSWFAEAVATSGMVGLSACVVSGDHVVWKGGFGKADIEQNVSVTTETVFMLASCSKFFTGTALLKLYESGHFDLDEDINRFLPFSVRNPAFPDAAITFRMLLMHISSIADRQDVITNLYGSGDSDVPLGVFVSNYFRPDGDYFDPLNFHGFVPGTKNEYSNIAYSLIGYLVERISEKPFPDFCREALFAPLEMRDTSWFLADLAQTRIARHYTAGEQGKELQPVPHYGWAGYPDGQLRSSAPHVANFLIMVMNDGRFGGREVLKKTTVETMLNPQNVKKLPPAPLQVIDQSLILPLIKLGDRVAYMLTGRGSGITTCVLFEPATEIGFVLLITGPLEDLGIFMEMVDVLMAQGAAG